MASEHCYMLGCTSLPEYRCEACNRPSCEEHLYYTAVEDEQGTIDMMVWLCTECEERALDGPRDAGDGDTPTPPL